MKRMIVSTICGIGFGFVCFGLASSGPAPLPWPVAWQIILSRASIGFGIGSSRFSMGHWTVHGMVWGLVMSLPLAFSGLMAPDNPEFSKTMMFVSTNILGMIYGLLTELVTSVFFKARQNAQA